LHAIPKTQVRKASPEFAAKSQTPNPKSQTNSKQRNPENHPSPKLQVPKEHQEPNPKLGRALTVQLQAAQKIELFVSLGFGICLGFGVWNLGFLWCGSPLPNLFLLAVFHLLSKKASTPVSYMQNTMSYCVQNDRIAR